MAKRLTIRAETDEEKAVWYGDRDVFLEGEVGYAEADKLAHYEDLEEQGRLIALPCKVGDAVYEILPPCDDTLLCETFQKFFISRCVNKECGHYIQIKQFSIDLLEKFGNTVFLTKEEAEAKLKERDEQE